MLNDYIFYTLLIYLKTNLLFYTVFKHNNIKTILGIQIAMSIVSNIKILYYYGGE